MLMRDVQIKNKEFIDLLDQLSANVDKIFADTEFLNKEIQEHLKHRNPKVREKEGKEPYKVAPHFDITPDQYRSVRKEGEYDPCGREYLDYMKELMRVDSNNTITSGFPCNEAFLNGQAIMHQRDNPAPEIRDLIYKISTGYLGGSSMALCALYGPDTFIPWHHNGNAPGYNILLHYNKGGEGSFYTYDNGEIITYPDKKGWVCRAGEFIDTAPADRRKLHINKTSLPGKWSDNPEDSSWHSAHAVTNRFTLSTIVNHPDIWEDLIDEIEDR
tara:strand:- start:1887 stop:2702 length:816 start_codon:yes stop_codon:yes gene_type:complete